MDATRRDASPIDAARGDIGRPTDAASPEDAKTADAGVDPDDPSVHHAGTCADPIPLVIGRDNSAFLNGRPNDHEPDVSCDESWSCPCDYPEPSGDCPCTRELRRIRGVAVSDITYRVVIPPGYTLLLHPAMSVGRLGYNIGLVASRDCARSVDTCVAAVGEGYLLRDEPLRGVESPGPDDLVVYLTFDPLDEPRHAHHFRLTPELVSPATCAAPATSCGCAELRSDPDNCGACGRACGPTEACDHGDCVAARDVCPPGRENCGGRCIDLMIDSGHCGRCDGACPTGETCRAGACGPAMPGDTCATAIPVLVGTSGVPAVTADVSMASADFPIDGLSRVGLEGAYPDVVFSWTAETSTDMVWLEGFPSPHVIAQVFEGGCSSEARLVPRLGRYEG